MYKLVRRYYGELCDKEQIDDIEVFDEVIVSNGSKEELSILFENTKQADIKNGFVIDSQENKNDSVRLFFDRDENWNCYIEMEIVLTNKDLAERIRVLANDYDSLSRGDFEGCLLALEDMFKVHYQELFNEVAKIIVEKRIRNFGGKRILNNENFINCIKNLEQEFDCDIDLISYSITPKYK